MQSVCARDGAPSLSIHWPQRKLLGTAVLVTAFWTVVCLQVSSARAQSAGQAQSTNWKGKLIWADEFNGDKLDFSKWEIEVNAFGGGNTELQIYTDRRENVRVENGNLVLQARRDNAGIMGTTREFSSGRIRSKHRGDWAYGRFEARAKLPRGQGLWPAIWMMPTEDRYGPWAASGEIDIMEFKGQEPNQIWCTLHFGDVWPKNRFVGGQYKLESGNFCDEFHTFALEWVPGAMRWYVDEKLVYQQDKWDSVGGAFPAPFDQPFHWVLNLAVGGRFVGDLSPQTQFPSSMLVDYVRVYEWRAGQR